MPDDASNPVEVRHSTKSPSAPSILGVGLVSGVVSGIISGMVCAVICLLAIFVVLPVGRGISAGVPITEEGTVDVNLVGNTRKGEAQVFYKQPFASPPHLTILEGAQCVITEQKPDSFKVSRDATGYNSYSNTESVKWKAEGTPAR